MAKKDDTNSSAVTAMLKKEMNKQKLARIVEGGKELPGSISLEKVIKIAKSKDMLGKDLKAKVTQVLGTCLSGGILIDDKNPKDVTKEINDGKYDNLLIG